MSGLKLVWGTRVKNPVSRPVPFKACASCGRAYTWRGLLRHETLCARERAKQRALQFALGRKGLQGELPL